MSTTQLFAELLVIGLGVVTFLVWFKLVEDNYKNIKSSYDFLTQAKTLGDDR